VYVWIWRKLPGTPWLKALQTMFLILVVSALLLFVVFPWIEPRLWFTHVTVSK
jgi:hypothetical protein